MTTWPVVTKPPEPDPADAVDDEEEDDEEDDDGDAAAAVEAGRTTTIEGLTAGGFSATRGPADGRLMEGRAIKAAAPTGGEAEAAADEEEARPADE